MPLPNVFSTCMPIEVVGSGGILVRQVDTDGAALDDPTTIYSVALPAHPVNSSTGANEDGTKIYSVWRKVTLSPNGFPVIRVNASGASINTAFGVAGNILTDPVITQTSPSGTNPPEFNVTAADLQVGWYYQLDYTTNGSTPDGTADSTQQFTSGMALGDTLTWGVGPFPGGSVVKWRIRYGPTNTGPWSNWSNTLSDTMAFTPADLFGASDIGYAWNTTDLAGIFTSNAGTGASSFGSVVGRVNDISGKGNHLNSNANDSSRPTIQNVSNGMLKFGGNGTTTRLKSVGGFYAKGATTLIMVVKDTQADADNTVMFWGEGNTGASAPIYAPGTRQTTNQDVANYQRNDASTVVVNTALDVNVWDNSTHVLVIIDTGTQVKVSKDGGAFVTNSYTRSGTFTLNRSSLGVAETSDNSFFGYPTAGYVGSGIVIGRVLAGTLGTAGDEITKAYNWAASLHGLATL